MKPNIFNYRFLPTKFDEFQMQAIISANNTTVINAGAGSGKTTTIIGRIIYLIADLNVSIDDIIVLVFNNAVASEIREKLTKISKNIGQDEIILNSYPNLDKKIINFAIEKFGEKKIHTFHSYSHFIINKYSSKQYSLSNLAFRKPKELRPIFRKLLNNKRINNLIRSYFISKIEIKNIFEEIKTLEEYDIYIKPHKITLNGDRVKSIEELEIANHLFLKGIQYKYEDPYPDSSVKYHPDFHLIKYSENGELIYDLYLEHFALNKELKAPNFFKNKEEYVKNFYRKKQKMKEDGNDLISTFSYQFFDQTIFQIIDDELNQRKIAPDERDIDKVITQFQKNLQTTSLQENLIKALSIFKLNELSIEKVINKNKQIYGFEEESNPNLLNKIIKSVFSFLKNSFYVNEQSKINLAFIEIFSYFLKEYENLINKSMHAGVGGIDFDDQIILGKKLLKNTNKEAYKHIIVDEFQDISKPRAEIIQLLLNSSQPNLFFIGDDWQSINGFSGSDLNIMNKDFSKFFGDKKTNYLKYTFRFNDKVCKITKNFMEVDQNLSSKNLYSFKGSQKNIVENNVWNNQIPFHFIYSRTNKDLNVGEKIKHLELGIGVIKKKTENSYFVAFKNKNKIFEIAKEDKNYYSTKNEEELIIKDIINELLKLKDSNKDIFFLTRLNLHTYKFSDIKKNIVDPISNKFSCKQYFDNYNIILKSEHFKKITFMTVHKSKGLEADYVFLLNVFGKSQKQGFPLFRKEDQILSPFIKCSNTSYESADEERRLFYVALTRSKNKTYVYTDDTNSFIEQITEINKKEINKCFTKKIIKDIDNSQIDKLNIEIKSKTPLKKISYHEKMKLIKDSNPNAYLPWTLKEENKLINIYKENKNIKKISLIMKRQPGGIRSRLKKLNLI